MAAEPKRPVGRPRTSTGRGSPIIAVRVSKAQKERLAAYMKRHGYRSATALVLERLRDVLGPE